jgi:hypothetical protein
MNVFPAEHRRPRPGYEAPNLTSRWRSELFRKNHGQEKDFGKRAVFPAAELKALYPTHAHCAEALSTAAIAAEHVGFIQ